jgi:DNA mismatch repair protein MutS2
MTQSPFEKLEINTLLEELISYSILPATKNKFAQLKPISDLDVIQKELDETDEALQVIHRFERAPLLMSSDYDSILDLSKKGGILTGLEIYETVRLFMSISENERLLADVKEKKITTTHYEGRVTSLYIIQGLYQAILRTVDETGYVLDSASPKLHSIRRKLETIDSKIKSTLQDYLAKEASKLSLTTVTMRDDRYCLAVKSEYKNSFPGVIHDVSGTMQTSYMEPIAVANLANEKEHLKNEEKEEVARILKEVSSQIAVEEPYLRTDFQILKEIDFIFAKAMLANRYDGYKPKINHTGNFSLVNARHPLLKVAKVIPNNVQFGEKYHGIIITGPNTGGKTVLLKTVGLLSYMVKYGLLIPADSSSDVMIYDQIFCDIGDDQSIENNLSTFSSHMGNIASIIDHVTPNSLVLFDEIGSGTDPIEGSNLAISILEYLIKNKVSFITTTHYSELKAYAFNHSEVINASMEFNQDTLSPTYHLILGMSGSSNAFAIAKRLGLKNEILEVAEKNTVTSSTQVRNLVMKLEEQSKTLSDLKIKLAKELEQEQALKQQLDHDLKNIEITKERILAQAHQQAEDTLTKINRNGEKLLDELKQLKNNKDTKFHQIIEAQHELNELNENNSVPKKIDKITNVRPLMVGDDVFLVKYNQYGTINQIHASKKTANVSIGNMTMEYPLDECKLVEKAAIKIPDSLKTTIKKTSRVSLTLDLRGERYENAKDRLDKYFDDLMLTGVKQATIIHGFGTGVIRELVQNFCKANSHIDSYRYGGAGEGGLGVTVITLK